MSEPALFRQRPWLRDRVAHRPLGVFPTPLERIDGLLPRSVELWVKREDRAGLPYGGNKVRKLEFLLADVVRRGKHTVFTIGGWGSHHALATAIYARELGLRCELALFPQPLNAHVREQLRADLAAGADVRVLRHIAAIPAQVTSAWLRPGVAYLTGGGSSVIGTLGWVSAADELREQLQTGAMPPVHSIYAALGSCGTVAGLVAGFAGFTGGPREIVAVRVVERAISGLRPTMVLAERTHALLGRPGRSTPMTTRAELRVEHEQIGAGYGHATPAALDAVARATSVGLDLDPTYTGKAMAQLIADAESGRLDGKRVLFLHTYSSVDLSPLLAQAPADALPDVIRELVRP